MSGRFHSATGRHDIGDADLDWAIFHAIASRILEAQERRLTPGRHRPERVAVRLSAAVAAEIRGRS